jgi:hypothetical protein
MMKAISILAAMMRQPASVRLARHQSRRRTEEDPEANF